LAVLTILGRRERRYEEKMARFSAKRASAYALMAAISGPMPRMFMTRVRL
jgi:hypothetical protein